MSHLNAEQIRKLKPLGVKLNGLFIEIGGTPQTHGTNETVVFNFLKGTSGLKDLYYYSVTDKDGTRNGYYAAFEKTANKIRVTKDVMALAKILGLTHLVSISDNTPSVIKLRDGAPRLTEETWSSEVLYETEIPGKIRGTTVPVAMIDLGGGFYQVVIIR